jgi:putative hydrolase of the HAD superfamily
VGPPLKALEYNIQGLFLFIFYMIIDTSKYKNIIFDLGGVLLNIDYSILIRSFSVIGLEHFEEHFSQAQQEKFFDLYEKGLISSAEFTQRLKKYCKPGITDKNIEDAWNAMLFDLPKQRMELLNKLKNTHRIFLLSNTNEIHMRWIHNYLMRDYGIPDFSGCFEKVYLSYQVNMRKPDAEIFELVLKENNLLPDETLFIDDSPQHLEGAKILGIHTYWLDVKKESINDVL